MPRALVWPLALASALVVAVPLPAVAQGGVLRVGLPSVPGGLDPATALEGPVPFIARQVYDTLVRYVEGGSDIEPALAARWSVSRDGLVWSFRLRDGVRFHDGTPLTAQQVVDSLERQVVPGHALAPSSGAEGPRLLRGSPGVIKEIRALDPRTVQISLLLPYAPLLTVLAHPVFSVVLPAGGGQWQGTGPFALGEVAPGRIVLEAKPGYWGGGPRLNRVVFVEVADPAQAAAALEARALDMVVPAGTPPRPGGALSIPGWRVGYLALDAVKEPFNRVKARRAVAAALDTRLIASALGTAAVPLQSFLPIGVWGRREGSPLLEVNPDLAKRLLAEAGFPRGISPTLLVSESDKQIDPAQVAEALRASLAPAGITLGVRAETAEGALALAQNGEHEMALLEARVEGGDPHFLLYALSSSEGATRGPGASNLSFYRNGRLDDLLIRASQLSFRPERQRLYVRAQAMLAEEMPWIPLYVRLHWAMIRPEVRNLRLHPSGNHRLDRVWLELPAAPAGD